MKIVKPTLIIDKAKATRNIELMVQKIKRSGENIRFRPHFKTHQSAMVGEWFRQCGVESITVSSVDMARYFCDHDWKDITLAVLVNPLQIDDIDELSGMCDLGLVVDSPQRVRLLAGGLSHPARLWIKIDTGYHRTGLEWNDSHAILSTAKAIAGSTKLDFAGILTHAGHAYHIKNRSEAEEVYKDTTEKMNRVKDLLHEEGFSGLEISVGDTPTANMVERFYGIDEMRCGNFVYNDMEQLRIGSCVEEDIAAAVACPVLATYPSRQEVVIYGGAVHLSKECTKDENGNTIFGRVAFPEGDNSGWGEMIEDAFVASLSQEHGIIRTTSKRLEKIRMGDILMILPVHSCLTVDLLKDFSMEIV